MKDIIDLVDLTSFGHAVKDARKKCGMTRDELAERLGLSTRHLAGIENNGLHPRLQVFYQLATMFNISVDQYFYPEEAPAKTSERRALDAKLDKLDDDGLRIVDNTTDAVLEYVGTVYGVT